MKKTIILLITVILTGALIMGTSVKNQVFAATGETLCKTGIIQVQADAEVMALPDAAFINFGVETARIDLATAQNENAGIMSSVMDVLKGFGIDAENIQTSNFTINPRYDYSGGKSVKNGYQVNNTIRVKLNNLEKTGELIDKATKAGANMFYGIEFSLTDKSEYYNRALKKALLAAREKAQLIAETQGVTLGSLVSVIENGSHQSSLYVREARSMSYAAGADSTPVFSGQLSIKAAIEVTYNIS